MKLRKSGTAFLVVMGFIAYPFIFAQHPVVSEILDSVRIDSMSLFVQQMTGQRPVLVGGRSEFIHSRHRDEPGNELAFQFAKQKFLSYNLTVDSLEFGTGTGKNLLGILPGTRFPEQYVMLGAHYDNLPPGPVAPGADDNASGCAAVLEAARIFTRHTFPVTIIFALWDEEEQGLLGSRAYAEYAALDDQDILAHINLDMLAWDSNKDELAEIHVRPIAQSTELAERATLTNSIYKIGLQLLVVNPGITASDHASFWNAGYTAIAIAESYSFDFNPFWHTTGDSFNEFNLPYYEKVSKLALATLGEWALDSATTGSNEEALAGQCSAAVYPNPSAGTVWLEYFHTFNATVRISLLDQIGKPVRKQTILHQPSGTYRNSLETAGLSDGIYYCQWVFTPADSGFTPVELVRTVIVGR
jgi:acetylornithine deacetylase/succinyl-diaminopimelate desuccinylase-like protein